MSFTGLNAFEPVRDVQDDMPFTGLNTRAGDLMTIKVKAINSSGMGDIKPTKFFTILHSDNIMEIRDTGVTVFD